MKTNKAFGVHGAIKPLYKISRIMCIWPYRYRENNQIDPLTILDKCIASILLSLLVSTIAWNLRQLVIQHEHLSPLLVITIMYIAFVHINTIYSIIRANINFGKVKDSFYQQIDIINKQQLHFDCILYYNLRKQFLIYLILSFTVVTLLSSSTLFI